MANPSSVRRRDSRFVQGGTSTVKEKAVGWWERKEGFNTRADDDIDIKSLPAFYNGRPDLLSYDLYQNNNLEWIILQYNNIVDINEEFVTGARILAPSPSRVNGAMLTTTVSSDD